MFNPTYFFNCACRDFGLENEHTIAIARIKEQTDEGHIPPAEAGFICRCIYAHGLDDLRSVAE